ncbi:MULTISPECIES: hypothetical protein [Microbacterium]|uniref:Uncharacterized protein n=1 Tax=Microbacterium trichothecenolyticum TaxID=69370 RepID=A0A0M2H947_MICTR|nr:MULTISPECIES: hypothetical protein [Microbacterium]KJL43072.1 hypothetical protein RS82_01562 [Microbacterium trichothecenolyticum]MDR7190463.1 hypothetical protein [Microbacterium sp. BE35]
MSTTDSSTALFRPRSRRRASALPLVIAAIVIGITLLSAPRADAAERGTGFGTWAPVSTYGWHGSMLVGGVHTYCITPGAPAPTGPTADHGISGSAAGLLPQQLAGINLLVTTYGQTDDPVQAAAVAWAVKAIANREETLHAFGYRGDSLAGAVHWTMSALSPQHDRAVQERAAAYYDEATRAPAGPSTASGSLVFTTDAADHRRGTVRVDTTAAATGTITLTNAVFAESGSPTLESAASGSTYAIRTAPPTEGRAYTVSGTGRFDAGLPAAVRHFTTPGGQETAGPAGRVQFEVSGADAAPRFPPFSPAISTQVAQRDAAGGPYTDEVTFTATEGSWPRADDGSYLPVTASAVVYRTDTEPVAGSALPGDEAMVGTLQLTTDPATGPTAPYTIASSWEMTTAGYYTAVWSLRAADQLPSVAAHTGVDFAWTERFGEPSQVTVIAPPPPTPAATPAAEAPPAAAAASPAELAATGTDAAALRAPAAIAVALLSLGVAIVSSRRPWSAAPLTIG